MDEVYSQKIVDNIKHEPEVHLVCYLPSDPETKDEPEVKEVEILLRKFDYSWRTSAKLYESYFSCGKCGYASKKSGGLKNHLKICETLKKCENCRFKTKSENIIKCRFCDQQYKCNFCKTIHISQVHRKDSYWLCSICDYRTLNKDNLSFHYQIHLKFSCSTCEQRFSLKQSLKIHQQQHRHGFYATQPEIKFECATCIRSFATKIGLRQHETNFHKNLIFRCDICGKILNYKNRLRLHMQLHFKVRCPICYRLLTERCLQRHIERHTTIASFKCDDCEKFYVNLQDLIRHKKTFHEIQQVQCDLCQKICKNKLRLRTHMDSHLIVSCPTCNKSIHKNYLYHHMKIHSARRESLACDNMKCHQMFLSIEEFEEHKKIHIGPEIYKCSNCNFQSKALQQLQRHMKCHRT